MNGNTNPRQGVAILIIYNVDYMTKKIETQILYNHKKHNPPMYSWTKNTEV